MTNLETKVGHAKSDETDVYIGRGDNQAALGDVPIGDRGWLGNPYITKSHGGNYTRGESIAKFRQDFEERLESDEEFRTAVENLSGHTLGCWCRTLDEDGPPCHGDVIAEVADTLAQNTELSQFG